MRLFIVALGIFFSHPSFVYGCSVCFTAADNKTTAALKIAILFLLGILLCVLWGIVVFFRQLTIRAKAS